MTKNFIFNIALNLLIVAAIYYGYQAYQSGNVLVCGIAIALLVVFIFFKRVLFKKVKLDLQKEDQVRKQSKEVKK